MSVSLCNRHPGNGAVLLIFGSIALLHKRNYINYSRYCDDNIEQQPRGFRISRLLFFVPFLKQTSVGCRSPPWPSFSFSLNYENEGEIPYVKTQV